MATQVDPVCGMKVEEEETMNRTEYLSKTYYFCSLDCKHKFDQRPEQYVVRTGNLLSRAAGDDF
jgi:YHS domain-containing protein